MQRSWVCASKSFSFSFSTSSFGLSAEVTHYFVLVLLSPIILCFSFNLLEQRLFANTLIITIILHSTFSVHSAS